MKGKVKGKKYAGDDGSGSGNKKYAGVNRADWLKKLRKGNPQEGENYKDTKPGTGYR